MTPSELYAYHFQNPEPKHYTRIPNIIDHLTYDFTDEKTGTTEVKRLSIYAKELYRIIKSIANEGNVCWMSRDKLAELCNFSAGMITKAKEELIQKFHQLDGNPLILIEEHKKTTTTNGTIYHKSMILDIWKWNNAYMATLKFQKDPEAPSPHDRAKPAPSPHDRAPQGARSPHDGNNNSVNNNPLFKEQQPAAVAALAVSFAQKNRLFPSDRQRQAYEWLVKEGCFEPTAYMIAMTYLPDEISKASAYTIEMIKKKPKENKWGYFQSVLKNKYWNSQDIKSALPSQ